MKYCLICLVWLNMLICWYYKLDFLWKSIFWKCVDKRVSETNRLLFDLEKFKFKVKINKLLLGSFWWMTLTFTLYICSKIMSRLFGYTIIIWKENVDDFDFLARIHWYTETILQCFCLSFKIYWTFIAVFLKICFQKEKCEKCSFYTIEAII